MVEISQFEYWMGFFTAFIIGFAAGAAFSRWLYQLVLVNLREKLRQANERDS